MKTLTLGTLTLALLGSFTLGLAEVNVDAQITAIKNAPAEKRVELMNQFKEKLATMNATERSEAVAQLRTQTKAQAHFAEGENSLSQLQMQTRERSNTAQMEATSQMQNMEQMNQRQGADQLKAGIENQLGSVKTHIQNQTNAVHVPSL